MSSPLPIRAVIFDLGGVVMGSPLEAIADFEAENNIPHNYVNAAIVSAGSKGAFQRLERGEYGLPPNMDRFYQEFQAQLESKQSLAAFHKRYPDSRPDLAVPPTVDVRVLFPRMLAKSAEPDRDFFDYITALRGSGFKVAALTNNFSAFKDSSPQLLDLYESLFHVVVESAVEGVRKPEPEAYRLACAKLGVRLEESAFLDDIGLNLQSAKKLGMATFRVVLGRKKQALKDLAAEINARARSKDDLRAPAFYKAGKSRRFFWDIAEDRRLEYPARLYCDAFGDATNPPVLMFHGGGQTRHAWGKTASLLAANGFFAMAFDMKGHGESYWDPAREYLFHHYSNDVDALIRVIGVAKRRAVLVGASLGGLGALGSGYSQSDESGALVLVDVTPKLETIGVDRVMGFMEAGMTTGFKTLEEAAAAVQAYRPHQVKEKKKRASAGEGLEGLKKNLKWDEKREVYVFHWDPAFLTAWNNFEDEEARARGMLYMEKCLLHCGSNVKAPTLLIKGKHTDIVSDNGVEMFKEAIPHAEVFIVNAGHMVAGDNNDAFSEALMQFLLRQRPALLRAPGAPSAHFVQPSTKKASL